jgi:hypothetical protein
MICSICEEVSQVPTGTRIPTAFINTLWDRRLESGRQRELICRRRACAATLKSVQPLRSGVQQRLKPLSPLG